MPDEQRLAPPHENHVLAFKKKIHNELQTNDTVEINFLTEWIMSCCVSPSGIVLSLILILMSAMASAAGAMLSMNMAKMVTLSLVYSYNNAHCFTDKRINLYEWLFLLIDECWHINSLFFSPSWPRRVRRRPFLRPLRVGLGKRLIDWLVKSLNEDFSWSQLEGVTSFLAVVLFASL